MTTKPTQLKQFIVSLCLLISINSNIHAAEEKLLETNFYEIGARYHELTAGFSNWSELYARGSWQQDVNNVWHWEVLGSDRFDESGTYFTGGLTHTFNNLWYGSLYLSAGTDVFFFPKYRVDAYLNRKFLDDGNLVGTIGVFNEDTRLINEDSGIYLGATYYFPSPWIIEAGIMRNRSSPGPEYSTRHKIAVTHGQVFDRYIIAEIDWGNEAYQFVSGTISTVDVDSTVYRLTWREWIKKDWGTNIVAEYYTSDTYDRKGVMFGVFKHF